jgi:hypothetical protein
MRSAVITVIIEVLHLLATLPAIEVVGPPPGAARPAPIRAPAEVDQRMLDRTRAMTQAKPDTDAYGRNTTRSFRQSFLTAYATRIGERLNATTDEVGQEAAGSAGSARLLPVLAARDDAVRDVFDKQFPHLTQHTTAVRNRQGWASGRAAADRAALHGRHSVAHE